MPRRRRFVWRFHAAWRRLPVSTHWDGEGLRNWFEFQRRCGSWGYCSELGVRGMAADLAALSSTGPTPKGRSRRRESAAEPGLPHLPSSQAISGRQPSARSPTSARSSPIRQRDIQRMKPCPSARPGTQGQGRGITQVAAQRNLGKPLTARGAEPLSRLVSQWKAPPVPARRIRGRGAPQDWSGWNGMNREEPERFHGGRANNRREGAVDMDPSGAGGERLRGYHHRSKGARLTA